MTIQTSRLNAIHKQNSLPGTCCAAKEAAIQAIGDQIQVYSDGLRSASTSTPFRNSIGGAVLNELSDSERRYAERQLAIAEEYANGMPVSGEKHVGAALFHLKQLRSKLSLWRALLGCLNRDSTRGQAC